MDDNIFDAKLRELKVCLDSMAEQIGSVSGDDIEQLRLELDEARRQCLLRDALLKQEAEHGRSPAVTELAKAQLEYCRKAEEVLRSLDVPGKSPGSRLEEEILYAEFAIDFAVTAAHNAIFAAMRAVSTQHKYEEENTDE